MSTGQPSAAVYCRISDDREGRGLGVERQREDCAALAARRGYAVSRVYVDNDISAYSGKRRPQYEQLLAGVRAGLYAAVLAWHPDRLHRNPVELEEFIRVIDDAGAAVATVTAGDIDLATPTGRMVARMIGAAARHESEHKAERVRRAMVQRALDGLPNGGMRAFGYEKDKVTIREEEAQLIREASARVLAGEPLRSIRKDWDGRVETTTAGGNWTNQTIKQVLTSARVAGLRSHNGEVVGEAVWPAIVDRDTWERVRAVLWAPGRGPTGPGPRKHVLVGLAHCGLCGASLVSRRRARDHKTNYVCPPSTDRGCGGVGAVTGPCDEEVAERLFATLAGPGLRRVMSASGKDDGASQLTRRIQDDTDRLQRLEVAFHVDGEVSRGGYLASRAQLEHRIEVAQRELSGKDRDSILLQLPADEHGLRRWWAEATVDTRHALLRAVVARVVLTPAVRAANRFDPSRVSIEWRA